MAKKKAATKSTRKVTSKKRHRRTDEELIEDLKKRIKELKTRQESRRLKESPSIKAALSAVRWIDKALDEAADESNTHLRHALADSRKPLEEYLMSEGLRLPKARKPRGRRPKA